MDIESLKEFYTYLRNLCVLVLLSSPEHEDIYFTLHELYKDNLERGYLHFEGGLHASRYWAVSNNALRIKKYDWAIAFIEKYKGEIIGETSGREIYRYNLANYLFSIGKFSECLDNIPETSSFADYLLHGKRMELKSLYELEADLLSFRLDNFKMFLSRTTPKLLSPTLRRFNSEFANFLTQIISSIPGDEKRADLLISRIEEKKQSAEWSWLLSKAQALKNK